MFRIVEHEELAPKVHRMRVAAPYVAAKAQPGQFVILVVDDVGERVPFTISDWDREAGTVDFVFIEVGYTTRQMASLKAGDGFAHFIGPLGRAGEVDRYGHVVAVASGYGIAGMAPVVEALKANGNQVTTILQAAGPEAVYGKERLAAASDQLILAVGDSPSSATSLGVLQSLVAEHPSRPVDRVVAMASLCLMHAVCEATRSAAIKTMVHLAPVMVDGTGMCGACRFSTKGGNRFACVHGPEFDGHEVDGWDVLLARRCTYADASVKQPGYQCRGCSQW
jgi:ferredoxin/flavodoxin---NADP+ reductase